MMKKVIPILAAFVLGLASGAFWMHSPSLPASESAGSECSVKSETVGDAGGRQQTVDTVTAGDSAISTETDEPVPPATVETIVDDTPDPTSDVSAAHAARRAQRQAAREKAANDRRDFLADLNRDLLTSEQLAIHDLYLEAVKTRNAIREEISSLRAAGKEIPAEMQWKLADAESVLRSDRETEMRILREAAARAAGLQESDVRQLLEDINAIDKLFH